MIMTLENAKAYATEANLIAALERLGLADRNPMIARRPDGKWTAIFSSSLGRFGGNITLAARHGFKTFA